ncbi:hypothetical protein PMM47T1_24079 [Pseudomonas sp. M47T1]|uniref:hypothetical protein n=1 Tax=Pseudomonas sp. M47T1 TaxID=1179778 RepID=UPI0002607DF7|nr:hypothetical protein [Pseudomonas sp. M47T1]EIK94028.1 hypothetical protein PMM47T1_24079 [Pseudomonas sp. M47T1]
MERKIGERGHQSKPTRAEIRAAWERLKTAAEQGNLEANALLIALTEKSLSIRVDAPAAVLAPEQPD